MSLDQEVKYINIKDLVLWTENPRDPINKNATDQEIVDRALNDNLSKWTLSKLAKDMGDYYDLSELPTVVYQGKKPIVYDGNRRIILGKLKHGFVSIPGKETISIPNFPKEIPCNVCSEKTALKNVYRKHSDSGSWQPLERDIFLHKFMGEQKSSFLILEEATGIISTNPYLNQRFVKDEIFREDILSLLGFSIHDGKLITKHSNEEALLILIDISQKIRDKQISTRVNRGRVVEVLEPSSQALIDQNKNNKTHPSEVSFSKPKTITQESPKSEKKIEDNTPTDEIKKSRHSKRTPKTEIELFGEKLFLHMGEVSNLYRDIVDLYQFYISKKHELSSTFPSLVRMSLRLLCETAAKNKNDRLDTYLKNNFDNAKSTLSQDIKTTLSTQNVTKDSIIQLLHTGAHNYQSSGNIEQTIAISVIVGSILKTTYGKEEVA